MRFARLSPLAALVSMIAACTGIIGDASDDADLGGSASSSFVCDPAQRGLANAPRRLSNEELLATYTALFGKTLTTSADFKSRFALLPHEVARDPGMLFDNANVDLPALIGVAEYLADRVIADATLRQSVLGCAQATDAACVDGLVNRLARRAYRRPLSAEEGQRLRAQVSEVSGADGLKYGVMRVLVSPEMTQLIETDSDEVAAERVVRVSAYEVASRLAFYLTGAPPDEALLTAAGNGGLATLDDLRMHAQRLIVTKEAREKVASIVREWLAKDDVGDPADEVAAELGFDANGFGEESRLELMRFVDYVIFDKHGTFRDLLTDKTAFPETDRLAKAYNIPASSEPVQFTDERGGILVRAATLMSGINRTSPIYRGVYVRTRLLCAHLPPPSTDALAQGQSAIASLSPTEHSNRSIIETVTQDGACQACHGLINPLGYALESLGPAGETRSEELVFDENGEVVAAHAIDTSVNDLRVGSTPAAATGARDLVSTLAASDDTHACFATQLIANTRMREAVRTDGCAVRDTLAAIDADAPVLDTIIANIVNDDIFLREDFNAL